MAAIPARMAELADAGGLNPPTRKGLRVQVPFRAQQKTSEFIGSLLIMSYQGIDLRELRVARSLGLVDQRISREPQDALANLVALDL